MDGDHYRSERIGRGESQIALRRMDGLRATAAAPSRTGLRARAWAKASASRTGY
jgi:hypothetical protein